MMLPMDDRPVVMKDHTWNIAACILLLLTENDDETDIVKLNTSEGLVLRVYSKPEFEIPRAFEIMLPKGAPFVIGFNGGPPGGNVKVEEAERVQVETSDGHTFWLKLRMGDGIGETDGVGDVDGEGEDEGDGKVEGEGEGEVERP